MWASCWVWREHCRLELFSILTCYVFNNTVPEALASIESGEGVWSVASSSVKNVGEKELLTQHGDLSDYKQKKCDNL